MLTLLIAEDEKIARQGIIRNIRDKIPELHFRILEARDGREGLSIARHIRPDIVLSDVRMPRMDGIEMCRTIKALYSDCILIFLSGYSDKEYLRSAITLQAFRYIDKPAELSTLRQALWDAVGHYEELISSRHFLLEENRRRLLRHVLNSSPEEGQLSLLLSDAEYSPENFYNCRILLIRFLPGPSDTANRVAVPEGILDGEAVTERILSEYHLTYIMIEQHQNYLVVLLMLPADDTSSSISCRITDASLRISETLTCPHYISLGSFAQTPSEVCHSYNSAVFAMETLFYSPIGSLAVCPLPDSDSYLPSGDSFHIFKQQVYSGDLEGCLRTIRAEGNRFQEHPCTLVSCAKRYFHQFPEWTVRYISMKLSRPLPFTEDELYEQVHHAANLDQLLFLICSIITACLREAGEQVPVSMADRIRSIIYANYDNPLLDICYIATRLNLSESYISILFKKETGDTINHYISEYRIYKARGYLCNKSLKIARIAEATGFSSQNYFAKTFHRVTGMTPSEYRFHLYDGHSLPVSVYEDEFHEAESEKISHRIESKILFTYLIPCLLVNCFLIFGIYLFFTGILKNRLPESSNDFIHQTQNAIWHFIKTYDNLTLSFSLSGSVQELFDQDLTSYNESKRVRDKLRFENRLYASVFTTLSNSPEDCKLRLYFFDSFPWFTNHTQYFNYSDAMDQPWFQKILEGYNQNRTSFYCIAPDENSAFLPDPPPFTLARVIVNKNYFPHSLAVLCMDFPRDYIGQLITGTNDDQVVNLLTSPEGDLIAVSENNHLFSEEELIRIASQNYPEGWNMLRIDADKYQIRRVNVDPYDLILTTVIPYSHITNELEGVRNVTILIGLVMILIFTFFEQLTIRRITVRLSRLSDKMKEVKCGGLTHVDISLPPDRNTWDEVDELMDTYNYMADEMEMLVRKQYESGKEIKNAELRALQAQINPHFLYNILDLIHWLADAGMVDEINQAASALSVFYRTSLSNGQEKILLQEELSAVKAYISLQNLRFDNAIHYVCRVDESLLSVSIIKMLLQPLVENALLHGILEKEEPTGTITVLIRKREPGEMQISVADDGVGIDMENLDRINHGLEPCSTSHGHGFGIRNINSRLELHYGTQYRLRCTSVPGIGTTVYLRLPIQQEGNSFSGSGEKSSSF